MTKINISLHDRILNTSLCVRITHEHSNNIRQKFKTQNYRYRIYNYKINSIPPIVLNFYIY